MAGFKLAPACHQRYNLAHVQYARKTDRPRTVRNRAPEAPEEQFWTLIQKRIKLALPTTLLATVLAFLLGVGQRPPEAEEGSPIFSMKHIQAMEEIQEDMDNLLVKF